MAEIERFRVRPSKLGAPDPVVAYHAGEFVRYSDHLSDKAGELEDLAGEFEAEVKRIDAENPDAPERSVGRAIAIGQAATRLRERAAELRRGAER